MVKERWGALPAEFWMRPPINLSVGLNNVHRSWVGVYMPTRHTGALHRDDASFSHSLVHTHADRNMFPAGHVQYVSYIFTRPTCIKLDAIRRAIRIHQLIYGRVEELLADKKQNPNRIYVWKTRQKKRKDTCPPLGWNGKCRDVCAYSDAAESKEQNKKKLIGYVFFLFWLFFDPAIWK